VIWRIMPIIFASYIVAIVDRINVGFAKLQMGADIGLSATAFGFGAGVFFIAYCCLEVPSNLCLTKFGARVWIPRIMLTWGLVTAATMFVRTPFQFYIARALLGVAEAGFYPGMIFYLSQWFPDERRAKAFALLSIAGPTGAVIAGPLSGWILTHLNGVAGVHGWQWLFLLQGVPAIAMSVVFFIFMPASPAHASWLSIAERQLLADAVESSSVSQKTNGSLAKVIVNRKVWLMGLILASCYLGFYSVAFWVPTLVHSAGVAGLQNVGFLAAIPFLGAALAAVPVGSFADRTGSHRTVIVLGIVIAVGGLLIASVDAHSVFLTVSGLTLAASSFQGVVPVLLTVSGRGFNGKSAAAAFALINTLGSIGSFLGPYLMGLGQDLAGSSSAALRIITVLVLLIALAATRLPQSTGHLRRDGPVRS
jgi:MFS family permease